MEIASGRLILNKFKSDIPLKAITPAEAQFLRHAHEKNAGEQPIKELALLGTVTRSNAAEVARLRAKYGEFKIDDKVVIDSFFPGVNPNLPQTFKEAGFQFTGKALVIENYTPLAADDLAAEEEVTPA